MSTRVPGAGAMRRWALVAWPLLQGTAAATLAWIIARYGLDHPRPFFAPVAAVIGLNASPGERGLNAVRLLRGVIVGIAVGELILLLLAGGYGSLALATFVAMLIAAALGGTRIVLAQAAVGAILTVTAGEPEAGGERMIDALVGVGVALVFTQLLFSPEPVALVRRASTAALKAMSEGLGLAAEALARDDDEIGAKALAKLRDTRDELTELNRVRAASARVAHRSAIWRSRRAPVVQENANTDYLDLLGWSCLVLARATLSVDSAGRRRLAPEISELAAVLAELAREPGDRETRQRAVDRIMELSRRLAAIDASPGSVLAGAVLTIRMVAADLMSFAGVEPDEAFDAVLEGAGEFEVPAPPPTPRTPFSSRGRASG
jgi:uncharacterized membrane protein YgaE (UPF0421/DUF939 family)